MLLKCYVCCRVCCCGRNVEKYPEAKTTPGVVVVRLDAPLFFANATHFEGSIARHIEIGQKEAKAAGGRSICCSHCSSVS